MIDIKSLPEGVYWMRIENETSLVRKKDGYEGVIHFGSDQDTYQWEIDQLISKDVTCEIENAVISPPSWLK